MKISNLLLDNIIVNWHSHSIVNVPQVTCFSVLRAFIAQFHAQVPASSTAFQSRNGVLCHCAVAAAGCWCWCLCLRQARRQDPGRCYCLLFRYFKSEICLPIIQVPGSTRDRRRKSTVMNSMLAFLPDLESSALWPLTDMLQLRTYHILTNKSFIWCDFRKWRWQICICKKETFLSYLWIYFTVNIINLNKWRSL